MNRLFLLSILSLLLHPHAAAAVSDESPGAGATERSAQYLSVNVDRVEVDIEGLAAASETLAGSIDRLALAIGRLSGDSAALSDEEKRILLEAVQSTQQASSALAELAQRLPQAVEDLSERLPRVISDAQAPITAFSSGLQSASDSVAMITGSLPQATENATQLANSVLDAVLQRLTLYTILLVAIVALALIGIMWFIYRQYLQPLTRKLDQLVGAPEHFENMARHMKETAASLQALQDGNVRRRMRDIRRYRRR